MLSIIRAGAATELFEKGLAELKDADLLVVSHCEAHVIAIALSVEPFNACDAWRDVVGSYVVKIRRKAGNFSHKVQTRVTDAPLSG